MRTMVYGVVVVAAALQTGVAWAAKSAGKPVALVEEAAGATPALQSLDYVSAGQVVELGAKGTLTLGYLSSCMHETITGGRVTIGDQQSSVDHGKVERAKVQCDGGHLALAANQARESGAMAVRDLGGAGGEPRVTVFDPSPLFTLPKAGKVVIKRVDMPGERHALEVAGNAGAGDAALRLDLAEKNITLAPGGTYMVSVGGVAQVFRVAAEAKRGDVPLVGRWVPF